VTQPNPPGGRWQPLNDLRHRRPPSMLVLDPRAYRSHHGAVLYADRVYVGGYWTPFVRVRIRQPRASDGATEY
jgi:hypothetical protein